MSNPWPRCLPCTEHQLTMECEGPVKMSTIESTKNPHLNLYIYTILYRDYILNRSTLSTVSTMQTSCTQLYTPYHTYKILQVQIIYRPAYTMYHIPTLYRHNSFLGKSVYLQIRPIHFARDPAAFVKASPHRKDMQPQTRVLAGHAQYTTTKTKEMVHI